MNKTLFYLNFSYATFFHSYKYSTMYIFAFSLCFIKGCNLLGITNTLAELCSSYIHVCHMLTNLQDSKRFRLRCLLPCLWRPSRIMNVCPRNHWVKSTSWTCYPTTLTSCRRCVMRSWTRESLRRCSTGRHTWTSGHNQPQLGDLQQVKSDADLKLSPLKKLRSEKKSKISCLWDKRELFFHNMNVA